MQTKQSNPNAFRDLEVQLKQLQGFDGKVGWFESAEYPEGTPVAYVAAIQELGYGKIPPRPFMRPAQTKNKEKWQKVAMQAARNILAGKMDGKEGMGLLCAQAEADVADSIIAVNSPALSPLTLGVRAWKRMGKKVTGATLGIIARMLDEGTLDTSGVSTKPLQDTGRMLSSISHTVESK